MIVVSNFGPSMALGKLGLVESHRAEEGAGEPDGSRRAGG